MDAIARSLHLGGRTSDFYAHIHIVDLYNVPLVEGECKIKWRFKGAMHLNNVEKGQLLDRAKEGTVGYLHREPSRDHSSDSKGKGRERPPNVLSHEGDDDNEEAEGHSGRGRLASFAKAIMHSKSAIRSSKRRSSVGKNHSPSPVGGVNSDGEDDSQNNLPDSLNNSALGRTPRASQMNAFSPYNSGPLSPSETIHPSQGSPIAPSPASRISTRLSYSANRDNNSEYARINGTSHLSRMSTSLSASRTRGSTSDDAGLGSSTKLFEPVTDPKGHTKYLSLASNACSFDQHVVCAVAIPLEKSTNHLQPSPVRLAVKHKVRVTPLPSHTSLNGGAGEKNGSSSPHKREGRASSPSSSRQSGSPASSTTSLLQTAKSIKEEHEEISLGEVVLDLSEFVEAGKSTKQSERWTSRRYLLQNGKTNALLRIAVRMEWLGGESQYVPPPLTTGQIFEKNKRDRNGSKNDGLSTHHHNSSNLMVHSNTSSRSISSVSGQDTTSSSRLRPPSVSNNPNGSEYGASSRQRQRLQRKATDTRRQGASSPALPTMGSSNTTGGNVRNSDQQAMDLIEEIFDSKIRSTPISQPNNTSRKLRGTAANHGYEAASKHHTGAAAIRDANVHHDLNDGAHRGKHPGKDEYRGLHNLQHLAREVMDAPTEAQMIAKRALNRQHDQSDNTSPAKSWTTPQHPSDVSPTKQKRNLGMGRPEVARSSESSSNLLKRPFSRSRTVSSSSLFSRQDADQKKKDLLNTTIRASGQPAQHRADADKEDLTPTLTRHSTDGPSSAPMQPDLSNTSTESSQQQRNRSESSGHSAARTRAQSSPSSGRPSPAKQKSVSWEDAPPADKEQIDAILRQVALRQEEREAKQEREREMTANSSRGSSRAASVRTGSSRTSSPERSLSRTARAKIPQEANKQKQELDHEERDNKKAESLRERGLLPAIALTASAD